MNNSLNQWLSSFNHSVKASRAAEWQLCVQAARADLWILLCWVFSGEKPFYITLIAGAKLNVGG